MLQAEMAKHMSVQWSCKYFSKICAKINSVPSQKWGMLQFCVFLIIFWHFMTIYGALWYCLALLWHCIALLRHFSHVTLFCVKLTFVAINALFQVKLFWHKPYSCTFLSFSMSGDSWQVTHDTWHMSCDTWWKLSQNFTSLAFMFWDLWCIEDLGEKDRLLNQLVS